MEINERLTFPLRDNERHEVNLFSLRRRKRINEMKLTERCIWARKEHAGLTQEQLAEKVRTVVAKHKPSTDNENAFNQQMVSNIESGRIKNSGYLIHIAVACGVSASWLQFGIEPRVYTDPGAQKDWVAFGLTLSEEDKTKIMELMGNKPN